jgi:dissimilatory sulfite reductase related protein
MHRYDAPSQLIGPTMTENLESRNSAATDAEGYLLAPADWTEALAEQFAQRENIALTEEHWAVLRFMRAYLDEHQVAADARFVIRFLADDLGHGSAARRRLFELFPYGYVQQACKIAGMIKPRAWSTG